MPEGVEVLKQTDALSLLFIGDERGYHLTKLKTIGKRLKLLPESIQKLIGQNLEAIFCKGKYFFIALAESAIMAHHGMSGCWSFEKIKNAHAKIVFLGPNNHEVKLYWVNERFGDFKIMENHQELAKFLGDLADGFIGLDILSEETWMYKINRFGPKKKIRDTFFDQRELCSGIGNYLIAEIFYRAKLHPNALFAKLSDEESRALYHTCKETIEGHYAGTLRKVIYKKEKDPEGRVIVSETIGSRTMHWVPEIQTGGI
jgi:formamidopyrimidine-DNA glycosylase